MQPKRMNARKLLFAFEFCSFPPKISELTPAQVNCGSLPAAVNLHWSPTAVNLHGL